MMRVMITSPTKRESDPNFAHFKQIISFIVACHKSQLDTSIVSMLMSLF